MLNDNQTNSIPFDSFSDEIYINIFSFFSAREKMNMAKTSKKYHSLMQDESLKPITKVDIIEKLLAKFSGNEEERETFESFLNRFLEVKEIAALFLQNEQDFLERLFTAVELSKACFLDYNFIKNIDLPQSLNRELNNGEKKGVQGFFAMKMILDFICQGVFERTEGLINFFNTVKEEIRVLGEPFHEISQISLNEYVANRRAPK